MYEELRLINFKKVNTKGKSYVQNAMAIAVRHSSMENPKAAIMYLWAAAIEDGEDIRYFYGRDSNSLADFVNELSSSIYRLSDMYDDPFIREFMEASDKNKYIARVYNIELDINFQFLRNAISDDIFGKKGGVFAREENCPMYAGAEMTKSTIKFFDMNKLITGSIRDICEIEDINIELKDEPEHGIITPKTKIEADDIAYVFQECFVVVSAIKKMRDRYYGMENIPLTQTGAVRRECRASVSKAWVTNCQKVTASYDFKTFTDLCRIFIGGSVHANSVYKGALLKNVRSFDMGSAYPAALVSRKYPVSEWEDTTEIGNKDYAYYYIVKFENVRCMLMNTFWPSKKIISGSSIVLDAGNVQSAKSLTLIMTDVDLEIFKSVYHFGSMEILTARRSKLGYMPKGVVELILKHYGKKTELKGTERKAEYMREKTNCACFYGSFVTRDITDDVVFDKDGWHTFDLTEDGFYKKRDQLAKKKDLFTIYQIGVWVTAYCREILWNVITKLDSKVVYFDTDCVKGLFEDEDEKVIDDENRNMHDRILNAAKHYGISPEKYMPKFKVIGFFEKEKTAEEFKTIGSKRYAAKYNGKIEIHVSGLPEEAGKLKIKDVSMIDSGLEWDTSESGRTDITYVEDCQGVVWTDKYGNRYESKDRFGTVTNPSKFSMKKIEDIDAIVNASLGRLHKTNLFCDL